MLVSGRVSSGILPFQAFLRFSTKKNLLLQRKFVKQHTPILDHFSFRLGTIKVGIKPTPWGSHQGSPGRWIPGWIPSFVEMAVVECRGQEILLGQFQGIPWSTDLQKLMKFIKPSNDDKKWKILHKSFPILIPLHWLWKKNIIPYFLELTSSSSCSVEHRSL